MIWCYLQGSPSVIFFCPFFDEYVISLRLPSRVVDKTASNDMNQKHSVNTVDEAELSWLKHLVNVTKKLSDKTNNNYLPLDGLSKLICFPCEVMVFYFLQGLPVMPEIRGNKSELDDVALFRACEPKTRGGLVSIGCFKLQVLLILEETLLSVRLLLSSAGWLCGVGSRN